MSSTKHRAISYMPGASSISISTRRLKRTGTVLIELKSPLDMVEWLVKSVHVLECLGRAMSSDLRWTEREKAVEKIRREQAQRDRVLRKAYFDYRLAGHKHRETLVLMVRDPRFAHLQWDSTIFYHVLPREPEARAHLKKLLTARKVGRKRIVPAKGTS